MSVNLVIGEMRQVATLANPGTAVPDGIGGFTQAFVALDPEEWRCAIEKANAKNAERHFASTVLAHATYILTGRYHSGITMKTQVTWTDRGGTVHVANVLDIEDTEGAGVQTVLLVSEVAS